MNYWHQFFPLFVSIAFVMQLFAALHLDSGLSNVIFFGQWMLEDLLHHLMDCFHFHFFGIAVRKCWAIFMEDQTHED